LGAVQLQLLIAYVTHGCQKFLLMLAVSEPILVVQTTMWKKTVSRDNFNFCFMYASVKHRKISCTFEVPFTGLKFSES